MADMIISGNNRIPLAGTTSYQGGPVTGRIEVAMPNPLDIDVPVVGDITFDSASTSNGISINMNRDNLGNPTSGKTYIGNLDRPKYNDQAANKDYVDFNAYVHQIGDTELVNVGMNGIMTIHPDHIACTLITPDPLAPPLPGTDLFVTVEDCVLPAIERYCILETGGLINSVEFQDQSTPPNVIQTYSTLGPRNVFLMNFDNNGKLILVTQMGGATGGGAGLGFLTQSISSFHVVKQDDLVPMILVNVNTLVQIRHLERSMACRV